MRTRSLLLVPLMALGACSPNQTFPDRDAFVGADAGTLRCVPNLDGRIDAEEIAPELGVPVSLLVNPPGTDRDVDVRGVVVDEQRRWDLSLDYADDGLARLEATPLGEHWFADEFPLSGAFVVPVDAGGAVLGVYTHAPDALRLHGVASRDESPAEGQTLLRYAAPVVLLRFPIELGDEHVSVGETMSGTLRGLPYAGRDVYEVRVVSSGRLMLPDLTFDQALRVDTRVTVEPVAGAPTSRRQVQWLFECFGEVARATSRPDETDPDFGVAAELRRLSLE